MSRSVRAVGRTAQPGTGWSTHLKHGNKPSGPRWKWSFSKQRFPEDFQDYWGQLGLDLVDRGSKTGWLALDGHKHQTGDEKDVLRDYATGDRRHRSYTQPARKWRRQRRTLVLERYIEVRETFGKTPVSRLATDPSGLTTPISSSSLARKRFRPAQLDSMG